MNIFRYQRSVRESDLSSIEKLTLIMLSTYHGANGSIHPSMKTLASDCGVSRRYITRIVSGLVSKKWVVRHERSGQTSQYELGRGMSSRSGEVCPIGQGGDELEVGGGTSSSSGGVWPIGHTKSSSKRSVKSSVKVARLRQSLAARFDLPLQADEATASKWLADMSPSEVTAALDDMSRRMDFAISKGSPMRHSRKTHMVCEVLEAHSEARPNRPELPLLSTSAPKEEHQANPKVKAALGAFFAAKEAK